MSRINLSAGGDRAVIDAAAGGRLASLVAGGKERMVTAPPPTSAPDEAAFMWGSYIMAPWAGRIAGNSIIWDGSTYDFPPNFRGQAIHGLVLEARWTVERATGATAVLSSPFDPAGRGLWPFGGVLRQRVTLEPGSLEMVLEVTAGDRSMPVSMGWHPWFSRHERNEVRLRVDSDHVLELDEDLLPTGRRVPVEGDTDLRGGPRLGDSVLDDVFTEATPPATITWPDLTMTVDWSGPIDTLVIHTPPQGFTVEPQTAWPNAPALAQAGVEGTGLLRLHPGRTVTAATTWTWGPAPEGT